MPDLVLAKQPDAKQPQEITDFLKKSQASAIFYPENKKTHFFLYVESPPSRGAKPEDSRNQKNKRENNDTRNAMVATEQASIAALILQAAKRNHVTIFVPSDKIKETKDFFLRAAPSLAEAYERGRIEFRDGGHGGYLWTQDYGKSVMRQREGKTSQEFEAGIGNTGRRIDHLEPFLNSLGIKVSHSPLVFEGGDVTMAINSKGRIVAIVGPQTVWETRFFFKKMNFDISESQLNAIICKTFGAEVAILLKPDKENPWPNVPKNDKEAFNMRKENPFPAHMFHLDQAVVFPKDGVALLPQINGTGSDYENEKKALDNYAKQLELEGFKVLRFNIMPHSLFSFQAYTNSIPISKPHGKSVLIIPSFVGQKAEYEVNGRKYVLDQKTVNKERRQTETELKRLLNKNDIEVIFVPNSTFENQGNVHCLTGALGRLLLFSPDIEKTKLGAVPHRLA